jgi:hypothetical protein
MPLTYFEPNELLTFLACMAVPLENSVTSILRKAKQENIASDSGIHDEPNTNALFLSGNPLEVSSSSSIVDATNHLPCMCGNSPNDTKQKQLFSVKGLDGQSFIMNLFENLFTKEKFKKSIGVQVIYNFLNIFDLENFLKSFKFPCLYGIGRKIEILEKLSDTPGSNVYMRSFTRGANSEEVDGYFEIRDSAEQVFKVAVECKNRNNPVGSTILTPILTKFLRLGEVKIGLIFCLSAVLNPSEDSALAEYCINNRINLYRSKLIRIGSVSGIECSHIEISPFSHNYHFIRPDPELVVFVFESLKMNLDSTNN